MPPQANISGVRRPTELPLPILAWHDGVEHAQRRVRASLWPVLQAALAASLAWLFAHRVLGHSQPFFAPIAAAVSLSTSPFQRSRRIVQMVGGVLLGIGIAELLVGVLGTSTSALAVTVVVTMGVARLVGAGFVGEGMMFVNQAAASAILVVTLHRSGTGPERAVDALVGGAAALVVGVLLFPSHPLPRLRSAERGVLAALADALEHVLAALGGGAQIEPGWTLAAGYDIHQELAALAQARTTARANVRIAPRRWRLRPVVEAEDRRIARLDLLANAVLSLVRAGTVVIERDESLPAELREQIAAVAHAVRRLADAPQPWPDPLVAEIAEVTRRVTESDSARAVDSTAVLASILRATARDLANVLMGETAGG